MSEPLTLDRFEQFENHVSQRLDVFDERFDHVDERFDAFEKRLDHVDERLDHIDRRFDTQTEVIQREMNDRFDYYEKRAIQREAEAHRDMRIEFAGVVEQVNAHITAELTKLRTDLEIRQEFDHLSATLAQRLGVSVRELTGR